jgi:hypothetical protein
VWKTGKRDEILLTLKMEDSGQNPEYDLLPKSVQERKLVLVLEPPEGNTALPPYS